MAKANSEKVQYWREHLKRWETSGMSRAKYCRQHSLSDVSLKYWQRQFRNATRPSSPECPTFVPVALDAPTCDISIWFGEQCSMTVPSSTDPTWIASLLLATRQGLQ